MEQQNQTNDKSAAAKVTKPLTFGEALTGFPVFEKMETASKSAPAPRQAEWTKAKKQVIPTTPETSTTLCCRLLRGFGGEKATAYAVSLEEGEEKAGERIRQIFADYAARPGFLQLIETYGFNAQFYRAVIALHRKTGTELEKLFELGEATAFNASGASKAAMADNHYLFINGRIVEIPTREKGSSPSAGSSKKELAF